MEGHDVADSQSRISLALSDSGPIPSRLRSNLHEIADLGFVAVNFFTVSYHKWKLGLFLDSGIKVTTEVASNVTTSACNKKVNASFGFGCIVSGSTCFCLLHDDVFLSLPWLNLAELWYSKSYWRILFE